MAKQALYVAARSGGRLGRQERDRVVERFNSLGHYVGDPEAVVELANLCLERRRAFAISPTPEYGENQFRITRT